MIKRIGQNKSLRPSNRQKFKGDNRETIYAGTKAENKASFKEFPESRVNAVIKQIREEAKSKRRKERIFLFTFLALVAIIILYALTPSNNNYKDPQATSQNLERNVAKSIVWSGEKSEPIKIPDSEFFYIPIVGDLDNEDDLNRTYEIVPSNLAVAYTINILFFDKDCIEIGKLLPQKGSIILMFVGPGKMIYAIAEKDSNNDGKIDNIDRHFLYVSDLNGKDLTRITDRRISSLQWGVQDNEILLKFNYPEEINDSIYGLFNTKTKELKLTNQPGEKY